MSEWVRACVRACVRGWVGWWVGDHSKYAQVLPRFSSSSISCENMAFGGVDDPEWKRRGTTNWALGFFVGWRKSGTSGILVKSGFRVRVSRHESLWWCKISSIHSFRGMHVSKKDSTLKSHLGRLQLIANILRDAQCSEPCAKFRYHSILSPKTLNAHLRSLHPNNKESSYFGNHILYALNP